MAKTTFWSNVYIFCSSFKFSGLSTTLTTGGWNARRPTLLGRRLPRVATELHSLSGEAQLRCWFGLVWFGLVSSACQVILQGCWLWPLWFGVDYICYSSKLILTILLLFIKDLRNFALEHWIFNLFELLLGKNKHHLRLLVHT